MEIGADKWQHALVGGGLTLGLMHFGEAVGMNRDTAAFLGFLGSVAISVAKELLWDLWLDNGNPEVADAVFGTLGAGVAVYVLTLSW